MTWKIAACLLALALLGSSARAQVKMGENTMTASGLLGTGYSNTSQSNTPDLSSWFLTLSGTLNGSYHDPRFLSYTVAPYLNQSNLNSSYNSSTAASGISTMANFLSASKTPMQATYTYAHDSESSFNLPGQIGAYKTVGNSQDFSFSAAYLPDDWPSLQGTISHGSSNYSVIGDPGSGTSSTTTINLGSSYELWNTSLHGSYTKSWVGSTAPFVGEPSQFLQTDANQSTWQVGATRAMFANGSLSANFAHTDANDSYAGIGLNNSYNNVNATYMMNPTAKLGLNAHVGYSSNLTAQYLANVFTGSAVVGAAVAPGSPAVAASTAAEPLLLNVTSSYLNYGAGVTYHMLKGWDVNGFVNKIEQGTQTSTTDVSSTDTGVGTTFSHDLMGGSFGAAYSIYYFWTPLLFAPNGQSQTQTQTVLGQSGSLSYSHPLMGWSASGSVTYGRGVTTLLVGYLQDNWSAAGNLSRNWRKWNFGLGGSHISSHVENISIADNSADNVNVSLGRKRWGVSGSYSRSTGTGFQVGSGIVPVPGLPAVPGSGAPFLLLYNGTAWGVGGTWQPLKRMTIYGSFSRANYNAQNLSAGTTASISEQGYVRAQYFWRQLIFNGGYSYLQQGMGQSLVPGPIIPTHMRTLFVGVSRRFDFF